MGSLGERNTPSLRARIRTGGLTLAGSLLIAGGATTSVLTVSATTHFYTTSISQSLSPSNPGVGSQLGDKATVVGHNPSGNPTPGTSPTVTFSLFGPDSTSCGGGTLIKSATVALGASGVKGSPGARTASVANFFTVPTGGGGSYSWRVAYSGNSDNDPSSNCLSFTVANTITSQVSGCTTSSCGTSVPNTGRLDSGLQAFFPFPGVATGTAGLLAGVLMLLAGPPLLLLARRSSRTL